MKWCERSTEYENQIIALCEGNLRKQGICLAIMGSFARRELAPHSDVDIILLVDSSHRREGADITTFTHRIHESVVHSSTVVRTTDECVSMLDEDFRSWLSLIESRPVYGDDGIHSTLVEKLRGQIRSRGVSEVLKRVAEYGRDRHKMYGDSVRLLEPNIKNSAGSLRDVQAIYYYALVRAFSIGEKRAYGIDALWEIPTWHGVLPERVQQVQDAWAFFLSVREVMHEHVGHMHDILDYELQKSVSTALGFGDSGRKETVESFMRAYYRHARNVDFLFDQLFLTETISTERESVQLDETFAVRNAGLVSEKDELTINDCMKAFLCYCQNEVEFSAGLMHSMDIALRESEGKPDTESFALFDTILRQKSRVGKTLRKMHEVNMLERVLPEFEQLVLFFQHNIYHYYTVDEHTLIALENAEKLANDSSHMGEVFRKLEDRTALYYAILFHDIAKPVNLPEHEIVGAEMVPRMLARYDRMDIADDVAFLVRHHLLMEQTAFRRNIHDRMTIEKFAQKIGSKRRLDLLYLLTYADMSAVNTNVWTDWKSVLLRELYELTLLILQGAWDERRTEEQVKLGTARRAFSIMLSEGDDQHRHESLEESIDQVERGALFDTVVIHHESWSEVTVVSRDAPFLLSRLAAAFLSSDAAIFNAMISTRSDGLAIDTFRVIDVVSGSKLASEQEHRLLSQLGNVLSGATDTEQLFVRHRGKWKRKLRKPINPSTRIDVEYHDHVSDSGEQQTIIDVYAPDTYGLLYKLTQVISSFRLTILFAKIATRVDGVVDSFYVSRVDGQPFTGQSEREELRSALLHQIHALTGATQQIP